jgi:hypothetical protein
MMIAAILSAVLGQGATPIQINPGLPMPVGLTAPGSPMTETSVVQAALPTVAPAFGNVAAFAGDRLVLTGACIVRRRGPEGQIATFERQPDGAWTTRPDMPQVPALSPEDFVLQRLACNADTLVSNITHKGASAELVWFRRTDDPGIWKHAGSIKGPSGALRVNFGGAIAMDGNLLAVGEVSPRPNLKDSDYLPVPRVYLFRREADGWKAEGALQRPEETAPWWFGSSLAVSGDTLVVGYPAALQPFQAEKVRAGKDTPMVCVYRKGESGWKLEQELLGSGVSPYFGFGNRVAIEGDVLAVQSLNPFEAGADVFVYRRTNGRWTLETRLRPGQGVKVGRGFGFSLCVSGGRVIVGDTSAEEGEDKSGRVFVFERLGTNWVEVTRLKPKVFCGPSSFGSAVAANWPWIAVGRVRSERLGIEPGGAYMFDMSKAPPPPAAPEAPPPAALQAPRPPLNSTDGR